MLSNIFTLVCWVVVILSFGSVSIIDWNYVIKAKKLKKDSPINWIKTILDSLMVLFALGALICTCIII